MWWSLLYPECCHTVYRSVMEILWWKCVRTLCIVVSLVVQNVYIFCNHLFLKCFNSLIVLVYYKFLGEWFCPVRMRMMTIGPAVKSGLHLHPPSGNHLHTVKKITVLVMIVSFGWVVWFLGGLVFEQCLAKPQKPRWSSFQPHELE